MRSVFSGYGIYKPVYGIWRFVKDIPFLIRCCHQRIHKGYCEKDTWEINSWFISVMKPMLEDLKKDHMGFPGIFEYEYWNEHKEELGVDYDEWVCWPDDEESEEYRFRREANEKCDQMWSDILERMAFLLNEMNEDTCSRQNPYSVEDDYEIMSIMNYEYYPPCLESIKYKTLLIISNYIKSGTFLGRALFALKCLIQRGKAINSIPEYRYINK